VIATRETGAQDAPVADVSARSNNPRLPGIFPAVFDGFQCCDSLIREDRLTIRGRMQDQDFQQQAARDAEDAELYAQHMKAAAAARAAAEAEEDDFFDDDDFEDEPGAPNGNVAPRGSKGHDPTRQIENLSQITHEPNDSSRRRRKRMKLNKLTNRGQGNHGSHAGQRGQNGQGKGNRREPMDYSPDFDPKSDAEEYTAIIQITEQGHGFMRSERLNFQAQDLDVVIPRDMVNRHGLRTGHTIQAIVRGKRNKRQRVVSTLLAVEGIPLSEWRTTTPFQNLTSISPEEMYHLSGPADLDKSMVLLELLAPIGKGQRGLLVAPPRTGKTMLMEKIANGIAANHPEAEIIMLLIDERPEEVTHLSRRIKGKVYASCLDRPIDEHITLSKMVMEMAMRRVECGKDVVILLDSITRMARAFNNEMKSSGRTLSGGVDAKAMMEPKKFFGAARKVEDGGSLTIVATALVQTGSQMDEVIFQEFKGTGNMELVLNRKLAEKRIYPAIDIALSGTRREELILPPAYYKAAQKFRRYLANLTEANQMPAAIQALEKFKTTEEFVNAFV
jgi:transcription termination factor Rho